MSRNIKPKVAARITNWLGTLSHLSGALLSIYILHALSHFIQLEQTTLSTVSRGDGLSGTHGRTDTQTKNLGV